MSDIKHIKTFYKGCNPCGIVDPNNSEIIRISKDDASAYAPIIALLSHTFSKAQMYNEEKITDRPYKISVVVSESAYLKVKDEDPETMLDRILWIVENFRDPDGGVVVSVYESLKMRSRMDSPYGFYSLWNTKKINNGTDSDYITLQSHGEIQHSPKDGHRINLPSSVSLIKFKATELGYDIKEIDYTTPISEVYELMINAKAHFGYLGSTYYLAAITNTPTVQFGKKVHHEYVDRNPIASIDAPATETIKSSIWNKVGTPVGKTLMYNYKHKRMYLDEPRFHYPVFTNDEIIERTKEILLK